MYTQQTPLQLHALAFQQGFRADQFMPKEMIASAVRDIHQSNYTLSATTTKTPHSAWSGLSGLFAKADALLFATLDPYTPSSILKAKDAARISARFMTAQNSDDGKLWLDRASAIAFEASHEIQVDGYELLAGLTLFQNPTTRQSLSLEEYGQEYHRLEELTGPSTTQQGTAEHLKIHVKNIELTIRKADVYLDRAWSSQDPEKLIQAQAIYEHALHLCSMILSEFREAYDNAGSMILTIEEVAAVPPKALQIHQFYNHVQKTLKPLIEERKANFEC